MLSPLSPSFQRGTEVRANAIRQEKGGTAILEDSLVVSYKTKHSLTI